MLDLSYIFLYRKSRIKIIELVLIFQSKHKKASKEQRKGALPSSSVCLGVSLPCWFCLTVLINQTLSVSQRIMRSLKSFLTSACALSSAVTFPINISFFFWRQCTSLPLVSAPHLELDRTDPAWLVDFLYTMSGQGFRPGKFANSVETFP